MSKDAKVIVTEALAAEYLKLTPEALTTKELNEMISQGFSIASRLLNDLAPANSMSESKERTARLFLEKMTTVLNEIKKRKG